MKSIFLGLHSTVHTSQLALALLIDRTTLDLQHPRCVSGGDIMNVDPNSVTAGVLSDLIKSSFESVTKGAGTYFGNSYRKIFEDFDPYMRETYRRIRKVRILCQKEQDVDLYDVYVSSYFRSRNDHKTDDELISWINEGNNAIINGNGGAGKTFFMRHFWITLFLNQVPRTPIFLELRKLNDIKTPDIKTFIRVSISRKKELDEDIFTHFCETGRFCFLLDGFDELPSDQRTNVQNQILDLAAIYPDCVFVVSSRYDSRFSGWQNFKVFESNPFNIYQVKELVEKVPFDPESKKLFSKQLTENFFSKHESFLSNPLLAIMMMMTFRENMNIPKRMSNFYDQAFNTLYQWHDATKAYNRAKFLDIDEFQRSFALFCMISYHQQKYEFTRSEIIDFINKSNKICAISVNAEDALADYEEAVNLIRQDGLVYVFIHRSFQEYFCAIALVRILPEKFSEMIFSFTGRTDDNVIPMCYEINPSLLISHYIKPAYLKEKQVGALSRAYVKGDYGALESMGAGYNYSLWRVSTQEKEKRHSNHKNFTRIGIRVNGVDDGKTEFFDNIAKVMSIKPIGVIGVGYVEDLLIHGDVFSVFDELSEQIPEKMEVEVNFVDGNFNISVRIEGEIVKAGDLFSEIVRNVDNKRAIFIEVNKSLAGAMSKIDTWCSDAISARDKMGRSLTEILDI